MKIVFGLFLAMVSFAGSAHGALLGLVNTGTQTNVKWTQISGPSPLVDVTTKNTVWSNQVGASWIGPQSNAETTSSPQGTYRYETTFDLSGVQHAGTIGVDLSFSVLYDNDLALFLNGVSIPFASSPMGYALPAAVVNLSGSTGFNLAGLNTLRFDVTNAPPNGTNPSGLNVKFLTQNSFQTPPNLPIPEPASAVAFVGLCLGGFALRRRMAV
jgi:hypothetical protein